MRILVTGAAGFVASHVVPYLATVGHEVVLTDVVPIAPYVVNRAVAGFTWDIRHAHELHAFVDEAAGCEALIHLAAIASPRVCTADPSVAWETNVRGTRNVLRLAQLADIRRVIFASSAHVYGISPRYLPTNETHPLALHDDYTMTKIIGEEMCDLFFRNHHLSTCILRFFNIYGWGQTAQYLIGAKLGQATAEKRVVIAGPEITKDWIAIEDVCAAIMLALESSYVGPLNIGTGVETSIGHIAREIADGFGVPYKEEDTSDAGPTRMRADIHRAQVVLGWEPEVPFEQGLRRLIVRARAESEKKEKLQ
jgi:UDP-glucose 4-epimerase